MQQLPKNMFLQYLDLTGGAGSSCCCTAAGRYSRCCRRLLIATAAVAIAARTIACSAAIATNQAAATAAAIAADVAAGTAVGPVASQQPLELRALGPAVHLPGPHDRQGVAQRPGLCVAQVPAQHAVLCGLII